MEDITGICFGKIGEMDLVETGFLEVFYGTLDLWLNFGMICIMGFY